MLLTGKASEDFYKWYNKRESNTLSNNELYYMSEEVIVKAIIIEWFISVNIWESVFYYEYRKTGFKDYSKAIKQAITKANEIYNDNNR